VTASFAPAAQLGWSAPSGCPQAEQVRRAVEEELGGPLERAAPLRFDVRVTVESDKRATLVLTVKDTSTGDLPKLRTLEADTCQDAVDAAVVAITLALASNDAEQEAGSEPGEPASLSSEEGHANRPAPEVGRDSLREAPVAAVPQQSSDPIELGGRAGVVVDRGSLPGIAPGVELGATLSWRRFVPRVSGVGFPERSVQISGDDGGSFVLFAGALAVCGRSRQQGWSLAVCAGSELGQLSGRGEGVTEPQDASSLWVAPRADLTFGLPLGQQGLALLAAAGAVFPLVRDPFTL
jgi:hypothetical protein